jgi:hypothetical protein
MDRLHEQGIKSFPAKTEGRGGQRLLPRLDGGVKCFDLTCTKVQWEVGAGRKVGAHSRTARADGAHSLHERGHDDPPHAPAWHANDHHREGRLAAAGAMEL